MNTVIQKVEKAIDEIKNGRMVILVDDEDRENEGDLCMAAQYATPEAVNFMAKYGRGLICLTLTDELTKKLGLSMMVSNNESPFQTAFTVSIEAKQGVTTGISAADRSQTILTAISDSASANDIVSPGHIFPLRAANGGVLVRVGQTEGSVDLSKLAGLKSAGVICEIMNEDGTMARMPDLEIFAKEHNLQIISIADIISYRMQKDLLVKKAAETKIVTEKWGDLKAIAYVNDVNDHQHLALVKGDVSKCDSVMVRVHAECLLGDVFGSSLCLCGNVLNGAMELINENQCGVLLYMHHKSGSGVDLVKKVKGLSKKKPDEPVVTHSDLGDKTSMGLRDFGIGAQILVDLGLKKIKILSNNPKKIIALEGYNLSIEEVLPIPIKQEL